MSNHKSSLSDKFWLGFGNLFTFALCMVFVLCIPGIVYLIGDIITPLHSSFKGLGDWMVGLSPPVRIISTGVIAGYGYFLVTSRRVTE